MALVLQRHVGQSVLVGEHLEVTLEHVSGPRVTIAIAHRAGGHAVRRTLTGPAARVRIGPVAIQARRAPRGAPCA